MLFQTVIVAPPYLVSHHHLRILEEVMMNNVPALSLSTSSCCLCQHNTVQTQSTVHVVILVTLLTVSTNPLQLTIQRHKHRRCFETYQQSLYRSQPWETQTLFYFRKTEGGGRGGEDIPHMHCVNETTLMKRRTDTTVTLTYRD